MPDQPLLLPPADAMPDIAIDAALVAPRLGLDVATFRALMGDGRIGVLCERGIGHDAGRYRATFYHHHARARFVVDAQGNVLHVEPGDTP
jgi:hypothetical protein